METVANPEHAKKLEPLGLINLGNLYWNAGAAFLYEQSIRRREGYLAHNGPLVVRTGQYTGRSPKDRFIVKDDVSKDLVNWGPINVPIEPDRFENLFRRLQAYTQGKDLFVQDCHVNADPQYQKPIRVITETAWHNLFARNMFIRSHEPGYYHEPIFTVLNLPNFKAIPEYDGTNSEAFVIISFTKKMVIIGGTSYGGEIKKSIFSVMNYMLPQEDVLPMHCSANVGVNGDSALFFGLSGTGKTTLSADPTRKLIGDDEHGWSPNGVFNMEGGCYAKVINLSEEAEPEIYSTTKRFGTILENVAMDINTRRVDLDDNSLTDNTRASYPITHIPNIVKEGHGPHPKNIIFLTADAFGVLPPISKLTRAQAMYHFISGYTSKLAGTERGVKDPQPAFSTLFGAPFMPLDPLTYAEMLGKRMEQHDATVWLVNTGWTGGPYGEGHRMAIKYTRMMVNSALEGQLEGVSFNQEPIFGLQIPAEVPGVPAEVLQPRETWKDKKAYDKQAVELAKKFHENFKHFEQDASDEIRGAGPLAGA